MVSWLACIPPRLDATSKEAVSYPVACGLCNIFSDLLGTQAERTNLGSQGGRGTDLTSRSTEGDFLDFIGVKLGRHFDGGLGGLVVGLVVFCEC